MPSIIITGAGSGVGRATAHAFIEAGWDVGLVGRREGPLAETAGGSDALVLPCDVTDAEAVDLAFETGLETWGRIDALFNNAGVSLGGAPIDELSVEDIRGLLDVNVMGAFIAARAAFGVMRRQDPQGGRIINNGSVSAQVPRWGSAPYTASKHAITGLTRSLSLDGRPFNIACGQIDIGNALTEMAQKMTEGVPQADGAIAVEPVMDVRDVAQSVLHMTSLPLKANVQFMTVMATNMPYIGRG
ncbi:SDR family oxidoreductase [Sulfitobacter sp. TSTF-M16]|uniref:SDR family oxidoreductase n=1 Tax=Sulfitobacter aestuariivivens TaxID=2766981 RepID=A0A927D6E7_9RHOB|nr:SDR family oxidoreductase [Sulfitobacter aestuariivivens]MBD3666075.1 SDR family oxidoreductase [Sulfitobacter aestuariivivens]